MEKKWENISNREILIRYSYREYKKFTKIRNIENSDWQRWQSTIKIEERAWVQISMRLFWEWWCVWSGSYMSESKKLRL